MLHAFFLVYFLVLPDLRSGGGFTLIFWLEKSFSKSLESKMTIMINGMSQVSGSLDEEDAADIIKGKDIQEYHCVNKSFLLSKWWL